MITDTTPFIILAVLVLVSIPITVAIVQISRKPRVTHSLPTNVNAGQPASAPSRTRVGNGRYELKSPPFKQGGMATIWMAKQRGSGKPCIIKTPRRGTAMDNVYLDKLMLEASYLKRLRHPNIVKYLNDFYSDGEFHLVLEYINGETMMASSPRIATGETKVVAWACQLLDSLAYVHTAGIIHRDINPKNIMLASDGSIKLIDFGTAKDLYENNGESVYRDPFTQIANKGFDIPELFMGSQSDGRSDLCGVSQTCIYLLTLRQPNELCSALVGANWPRNFSEASVVADFLIAAGVSSRTARCLAQAVMFEPAHRFSDARAMLCALSATGNGQGSKSREALIKK